MKMLIVEDEKIIREQIAYSIPWRDYGMDIVDIAENGQVAYDKIQEEIPDIILTDIRMPKMTGLELLEAIREKGYESMVILLTAYDDFTYVQQALKIGAFDYILKIAPTKDLIDGVLRARDHVRTIQEKKRQSERQQQGMIDAINHQIKTKKEESVGEILEEIIRYIDNHIDFDLSLQAISKQFHMNKSSISILFKNKTGVYFKDYTMTKRMEKAKQLLHENMRTKVVANQVGYQDDKYFAHVFKRVTGMSPAQYKQWVRS